MKKLHYFGIGLLLILSSCSPKITLTRLQDYLPCSSEDSITVVNEGEKIPVPAKLIANIAILDRGFTVRCKYDQILKIAKNETRKAGGNILQITDHQLPSI